MNRVIITTCFECSNWAPTDSYGNGVYCDELGEVLSTTEIDYPIPDKCPKLEKNKGGD